MANSISTADDVFNRVVEKVNKLIPSTWNEETAKTAYFIQMRTEDECRPETQMVVPDDEVISNKAIALFSKAFPKRTFYSTHVNRD